MLLGGGMGYCNIKSIFEIQFGSEYQTPKTQSHLNTKQMVIYPAVVTEWLEWGASLSSKTVTTHTPGFKSHLRHINLDLENSALKG